MISRQDSVEAADWAPSTFHALHYVTLYHRSYPHMHWPRPCPSCAPIPLARQLLVLYFDLELKKQPVTKIAAYLAANKTRFNYLSH
jgi:hypothetical protein